MAISWCKPTWKTCSKKIAICDTVTWTRICFVGSAWLPCLIHTVGGKPLQPNFVCNPALVRIWHFFCCKIHIKFRHCVWKFIKTPALYLQMQRGTLDAGALRIGDGESISRSNGIEFSILRCYWIQNLRQEKYLVWSWICWWGWNIFDGDICAMVKNWIVYNYIGWWSSIHEYQFIYQL